MVAAETGPSASVEYVIFLKEDLMVEKEGTVDQYILSLTKIFSHSSI